MSAGTPALGRPRAAHLFGAATKRAIDIVLGAILCIVTLPVVLVIAIGVAASLRYWPFFAQKRPGRDGRTITILKIRTLPSYTPRYQDKHTLQLDTIPLPWLCGVLRRTHLDELPQLASVVLGHMSLVGPRPPLPSSVEPVDDAFEQVRRTVRPGCTGLWQISVAASDTATSAPRFDLFYVYYASLRLDLWIVVRTVGWMLGIVKPIELEDIPRWLIGPGLVGRAERQLPAVDGPVPAPAPAVVERVPAPYARMDPIGDTQVATESYGVLGGALLDGAVLEVAD